MKSCKLKVESEYFLPRERRGSVRFPWQYKTLTPHKAGLKFHLLRPRESNPAHGGYAYRYNFRCSPVKGDLWSGLYLVPTSRRGLAV